MPTLLLLHNSCGFGVDRSANEAAEVLISICRSKGDGRVASTARRGAGDELAAASLPTMARLP
jgi:hypothetical protein